VAVEVDDDVADEQTGFRGRTVRRHPDREQGRITIADALVVGQPDRLR